MRIAVGGIIHPRESVICYLNHMRSLHSPASCEIQYLWVIDGQGSGERLREQIADIFPLAKLIMYEDLKVGTPYFRGDQQRKTADGERSAAYERLAHLRNRLRKEVLAGGYNALLSVDSDILVPSDLAAQLQAVSRPWVGALVRNHPTCLPYGKRPSSVVEDRIWNVLYLHNAPGEPLFEHFKTIGLTAYGDIWPSGPTDRIEYPRKLGMGDARLITGAVCWYSREILERVKFAGMEMTPLGIREGQCGGEDIAFGIRAIQQGFSAWYIPLICEHLMSPRQIEQHLERCPSCASMMSRQKMEALPAHHR